MTLSVKGLALGLGVTWGLGVLLLGWAGWLGYGTGFTGLSSIYLGYDATFLGGIIGALWGFVDGAIGGALIAWVYNKTSK